MITQPKRETRDVSVIVEEELRRINAPQLRQEVRGLSAAMIAMGVLEIIAGVLAIGAPFFAGAFFVLLLGTAVLVSGVIQIIHGLSHNSTGRFVLGLISSAAGALVLAHPIFGLTFLTLALGIYLIASGIARLSVAGRSGWQIFSGILGIVLGALVLAGWPSTSAVIIGLFIGVNILVGGISAITMGSRLRRAAVTNP